MPNQVSISVRLILKPFLFDYNEKSNERPVPPGATFCPPAPPQQKRVTPLIFSIPNLMSPPKR